MSTDATPPGVGFDPSHCDRMVIHLPGQIQPHGALLVVRPADLVVVQASDNTGRWLGSEPGMILGRPLDDVFGVPEAERLRTLVARERLDSGPRFAVTLPARGAGPALDVTAHARDGVLILELEPAGRSEAGAGDPYALVRDAVARLQSSADVLGFCQGVVEEVKRVAEFDRVILYRFAADWSGRVIAEAREPDFDSLLDKHFPAGDVPRPARELMTRNWLRLVPDVEYEPVPLTPAENPVTGRPLDMTWCLLRHASPVCTTYLKNFGTACLMTMPLLRNGVLWGMVACHHRRPRFVPFAVRAACEILAQVASLQIATAEDRESLGERLELTSARDRLVAGLDETDDPCDWLARNAEGLADYLSSDGLAVGVDDQVILLGQTPAEEDVRALLLWLRQHHPGGVCVADGLSEVYPPAAEFLDRAAGLLAVDFGTWLPASVAWFRREHVATVTWAGDPRKPVVTGPLGAYLSPRESFGRWAEAVRGKGTPWRPVEVEGAARLKDAVLERVRTRAGQGERLRAELEAGRRDVDSFVYVASHDLKEPLRGIHKYARLLIERSGAKLDPEEMQRLDGLVRLADRMGDLIEALLHLSRVGRLDLSLDEVDLDAVAAEAVEVAAPRAAEAGARLTVGPMGTARCDRAWVREVLVNLITNALKYNDKSEKTVEIGRRPPAAPGEPPAFFVRDNGIGIPTRHREAVFAMFKRLHGRDEYGGGTGAGLAIARKIVERHGGRMWVESTPGVGSAFCFTLAAGGTGS
ncbi:MAG: ATP-binding protein [Isosphaeraceae bacterium]